MTLPTTGARHSGVCVPSIGSVTCSRSSMEAARSGSTPCSIDGTGVIQNRARNREEAEHPGSREKSGHSLALLSSEICELTSEGRRQLDIQTEPAVHQ